MSPITYIKADSVFKDPAFYALLGASGLWVGFCGFIAHGIYNYTKDYKLNEKTSFIAKRYWNMAGFALGSLVVPVILTTCKYGTDKQIQELARLAFNLDRSSRYSR